jgi:hypothetical protein
MNEKNIRPGQESDSHTLPNRRSIHIAKSRRPCASYAE